MFHGTLPPHLLARQAQGIAHLSQECRDTKARREAQFKIFGNKLVQINRIKEMAKVGEEREHLSVGCYLTYYSGPTSHFGSTVPRLVRLVSNLALYLDKMT